MPRLGVFKLKKGANFDIFGQNLALTSFITDVFIFEKRRMTEFLWECGFDKRKKWSETWFLIKSVLEASKIAI